MCRNEAVADRGKDPNIEFVFFVIIKYAVNYFIGTENN